LSESVYLVLLQQQYTLATINLQRKGRAWDILRETLWVERT